MADLGDSYSDVSPKGKGKGKCKPPPPVPPKSSAPFAAKSTTGPAAKPPAALHMSLAEQLAGRQLRKVETPQEKKYLEDVSHVEAAHRHKYFASAADQWMFIPGIAEWTFETKFLELGQDAARDLLAGHSCTPPIQSLKLAIDEQIKESGWKQAFAKLTTFSPKDSPLLLQQAEQRLLQTLELSSLSGPEMLQRLNECMTESLSISDGEKAVQLLSSSPRVKSDLKDALDSLDKDAPTPVPNICLRRWDGPLPIHSEFRGFVWEGKLNALGQYVYNMYFEELQDSALLKRVEEDILEAWSVLGDLLTPTQPTCIIDFAWSAEGFAWAGGRKVILIEVNPFDGEELGMGELTTGIFKVRDNPKDLEVVKSGPFELRVKRDIMTEDDFQQMVCKLPGEQREVFERLGASARKQ